MTGLENFHRGDTQTYSLTFKDDAGVAIDVSGMTIWATFKTDPDALDAAADIQVSYTFPNDANSQAGIGTLTLTTTDTSVPADTYQYDFQLVDPATTPSTVTTLAYGKVKILQDVTKDIV